MGKIRVKTFDENSAEDEVKLKAKREAKKAGKMALRQTQGIATKNTAKTTPAKRAKTSEEAMLTSVESVMPEKADSQGPSPHDQPFASSPSDLVLESQSKLDSSKEIKPAKKSKKEKFAKARIVGKRQKENLNSVSKTQTYSIDQAITALKQFKKAKFDETVELHINTKEKGVSGQVTLPHGTGKTLVIKIATDEIIAEVSKGKIDFDVLVATPSMMPQLARVAKVLGPRGLMPNPKNGTITDKPEEAVKKLSGGQINYKTESENPIIHARVGKISFEDNKIKDNITTFIASVGDDKINSVVLKSTMSPGIKLAVT